MFTIEHLYESIGKKSARHSKDNQEILVEFSLVGIKKAFEGRPTLLDTNVTLDDERIPYTTCQKSMQ